MLLRNYDLLCALQLSTFKKTVIDTIRTKIKTTAGSSIGNSTAFTSYIPFNNFIITNNVTGTNGYSTLVVGSDDTPVTYDDYKISLISGLTGVSATEFQTGLIDNETIFENTIKTIYTNSNADTVIIKEIGVYYNVANNTSYATMIYREVLDTPIEVPSGANVVISLTKKINLCSNQPAEYTATATTE